MKIQPLDPKPKTNLGRTLGENLLKKQLIRSMYEFAKLVTKTSSKIQEPKTYNKAINDLIYGNWWQETINKEL